jgi:predicted ATP-dependent endonuclease of OLD family
MRLKQFRVANFRNINDSGWIDLAGTTALVGRNESGKTNLLHALRSLSGPDAGEALSLTRDFPADRMRSEYSDDLDVVQTRWELTGEERTELAEILPRASQVAEIEIGRG